MLALRVRRSITCLCRALYLSGNQLEGTLPASLSLLSALQVFSLYTNRLSGTVPVTLTALTAISVFDISDNQLSGNPFDVLTALTALTYVCRTRQCCQNLLRVHVRTGDRTDEGWCVCARTGLNRYVRMPRNILSGTMPSTISRLQSLQFLRAQDNLFTGSFPEALYSLGRLSYVRTLQTAWL